MSRARLRLAALALGLGSVAASCALVGYDLDGYKPANGSGGGAGHGGASSSRASSGSGGTAGGSSGGGPAEDCTNGVDDDDDGLVDCADPKCSAFACAPDPPAGWSGPFELYAGGNAAIACGGAFATAGPEGGTGVTAAPVTCGGCSCDLAPCAAMPYYVYGNAGCGTLIASGTSFPFPCAATGPPATWGSIVLPAVGITAGCPAHGGGVTSSTPPSYNDHVLLCGPAETGRGCGAHAACVRRPEAPFGDALCVAKAGEGMACPPDYPTSSGTVYTGIDDTRDCTGCGCGPPASNLCNASALFFSDAGCQAAVSGAISNGTCYGVGTFNSYAFYEAGPGCTPNGGQPTGAANGKDGYTVCCR